MKSAAQGVLLVNLGSPASPQVADVRAYLDEFLMDARVLDFPAPLRRLIVSGFILPNRPRQSAHAYQSIWTAEGSPLIVYSRRLQARLQEILPAPVELAMRYGQPSIQTGLELLIARKVKRIVLVPLYPQYAMSTVETVVAAAQAASKKMGNPVELRVLPPFYNHPRYIQALVASSRPALEGDFEHLVFSYHGVPERHLRKTDPTGQHCLSSPACCTTPSPAHAYCYAHQARETTRLFIEAAGLRPELTSVAFQSRLGRDVWLQPATEAELRRLAAAGTRKIQVICPAFVADCLETLEEIGMRGKETFLAAGGESYQAIPCLNDHPAWVAALAELINPLLG